MRAFTICALSAATAYAASGPKGDYDYTTGGENWYKLDGNAVCGTGKSQSPINIREADSKDSYRLGLALANYAKTSQAVWYGDTPAVNMNTAVDASDFTWKDAVLTGVSPFAEDDLFTAFPAQFHLHTPSEHQVEGKHFDGEIHVVHSYQQESMTKYAVLGLFLSADGAKDNKFVQDIIDLWALGETGAGSIMTSVDMGYLHDSEDVDLVDYWHYEGSFTTPPCTEGVNFYISKTPLKISDAQLLKLQTYTQSYSPKPTPVTDNAGTTTTPSQKNSANENETAGNNRMVQALNERVVYSSVKSQSDGASALLASASAIAIATFLAF